MAYLEGQIVRHGCSAMVYERRVIVVGSSVFWISSMLVERWLFYRLGCSAYPILQIAPSVKPGRDMLLQRTQRPLIRRKWAVHIDDTLSPRSQYPRHLMALVSSQWICLVSCLWRYRATVLSYANGHACEDVSFHRDPSPLRLPLLGRRSRRPTQLCIQPRAGIQACIGNPSSGLMLGELVTSKGLCLREPRTL